MQQSLARPRVQAVRERADPCRILDVAEDVDPALRHADQTEDLRAAPPDGDARTGGAGSRRERAVGRDGDVRRRVGRADAVVVRGRTGEPREPRALRRQLTRPATGGCPYAVVRPQSTLEVASSFVDHVIVAEVRCVRAAIDVSAGGVRSGGGGGTTRK